MKTEYITQSGKAEIYCNKILHRRFEPYFYVRADETIPTIPEIIRVEDTDRYDLYGNKLKKIITNMPSDVGKLREKFSWSGEADIRFTKRFIVDKGIKQINKNKILIDIENPTPAGSEISSEGKYPIAMICAYSEINDVYHQWVQHPKLFNKEISKPWKNRLTGKQSKRIIHQNNDERAMLLDFVSYVAYHKPDMIIEFSKGKMYDMSNIIERCKKLKINYRSLSPIKRVKNDKYTDIGGIEAISMLPFYQKHHIGELSSSRLDDICKEEFGIGKLYLIDDYMKEYEENLSGFIDYNLADVECMVNLDQHTKLFENIQYIIDGIGCEMNDYLSSSMVVRMHLLKKAIEYGVVLDTWKYDNIISFTGYDAEFFNQPDIELIEYRKEFDCGLVRTKKFKSKYDENKFINAMNKKYKDMHLFTMKGAHVIKPKSGLYDDVELYDYKGMYPNIIIEKNMSPETLVKYEDRGKYDKSDLHDIGNGVYFLKQSVKKGFLPKVLEELFSLRYDVKDQMKNVNKNSRAYTILDGQQTGIKYLINSFYGVMKNVCIWIAESTTFVGQLMLKDTIDEVQILGCEVVYGDTDSIYIIKKNFRNKKTCSEKCKWYDMKLEDILMKKFKDKWRMDIELEHEGSYPQALFLTKKRYVVKDVDGKYKYKGIEVIRSDASEFHKTLQKSIIDMIFKKEDKDIVIQHAYREIKDISNKEPTFLARRVKLNFERNTKSKITKFEKAARNATGKDYKTGDKPYYLPGICFDYVEEVSVSKQMVPEIRDETVKKMKNLFDALGWDVKDLLSEYRQERFEI